MSRKPKNERLAKQLEEALSYHRKGDLDRARSIYRRVVDGDRSNADALHLLGMVELSSARRDAGLKLVANALRVRPLFAEAWATLGGALAESDLPGALEAYRRAVAIDPAMVQAIGNMSLALHQDPAGAIAWLRRAGAITPASLEVLFNLGTALARTYDMHGAWVAFARALAIAPAFPAILGYAGRLGGMQGDGRSKAWFRRAVAAEPANPMNAINLAAAMLEQGERDEAEALLKQILREAPDNADAHGSLGILYRQTGALDASLTHLKQAIALRPANPLAHRDLGTAMLDLGEASAAFVATARSFAVDPADHLTARNLLATTLYDNTMSHETRWALHRRALSSLPRRAHRPASSVPPRNGGPLRVAYVSSDFRNHPTGRLLVSLFSTHDAGAVSLFGYSLSAKEDRLTQEIRDYASAWRTVANARDTQIADMMQQDGIDIAVFVALHFDANRPSLAAWRCAPVQVSLGDVTSSGIDEMDYLISDRTVTPRNGREIHSERIVAVPSIYYHPPLSTGIDQGPLPSLSRGRITFGSYNLPSKMNDDVIRLWARVLEAVPGSTLALRYRGLFGNPATSSRVTGLLGELGIDADRLEFHGAAASEDEYFTSLRAMDVALDTFPFNGHTSTFEALWMGVPVVTLAGRMQAGRYAAAQLKAVGLGDLIAATEDDYVSIASALARDVARRTALRQTLRARLAGSAICDARRLSRHLERIYRAIGR